jgi:hypothetical protein
MPELCSGQLIGGRFRLLGKLGSGGHGEVWRAREERARSDIALKILFPEVAAQPGAEASLEREYAISARLRGPGILQVFAPVITPDATVLPMAIAAGGDLRQFRGADFLRTVPLLMELAAALEAVHASGVIHRDLKPGNVLIDGDGHVQLADFGVAAIDGETPRRRLGSPFNSSPQQLAGLPPTPADDVYGLGTLAYELLSGQPPFYPNGDPERITSTPVPELLPARPCPIRLTTLVMGMLSKRPTDRPTLASVIEGLEESLSDTLPFEDDPGIGTSAAAHGGERDPIGGPLHDLTAPPEAGDLRPADRGHPGATAPRFVAPTTGPAASLEAEAAAFREPRFGRIEAMAAPRWPYAVLVSVMFAMAATLFTLARLGPVGRETLARGFHPAGILEPDHLPRLRARLERRLIELDARGAAVWGGRAFADARAAAEGGRAAFEAGDPIRAEARWNAGVRDLAEVTMRAPDALAEQLAAGDAALAAGDPARALQAYSVARLIEPGDQRAIHGVERSRAAGGAADSGRTASAPAAAAGSG